MNTKTDKQEKKKTKITGLYLLLLVVSGYFLLYIYSPDKTVEALSKSMSTLVKLLPIFIIVIVLMSIFNALINAKKIAKLLGNESGFKGWLIALVGGILSHGSSYIWYQMLANLREHKAKDGLIVTFLYARAIKLPWLPLMVSYFGYAFTVLLMIYIIVGAVIQGLITEKLKKAENS